MKWVWENKRFKAKRSGNSTYVASAKYFVMKIFILTRVLKNKAVNVRATFTLCTKVNPSEEMRIFLTFTHNTQPLKDLHSRILQSHKIYKPSKTLYILPYQYTMTLGHASAPSPFYSYSWRAFKMLMLVGNCVCFSTSFTLHKTTFGIHSLPRKRWAALFANPEIPEASTVAELSSLDLSMYSSKRQLWLDLRGTMLSPKEAFAFLQQSVFDNAVDEADGLSMYDVIDRVLVSEQDFCVSNNDKEQVDFLYETTNGDLVLNLSETHQSVVMGKVVSCWASDMINPLTTLETTSTGQWIVLDVKTNDDDELISWMQTQVASLLTFLSTTSLSAISLNSGLTIPSGGALAGGIAITCPTRKSLCHMDSILTNIMCDTMISSSTDSGILLSTGARDTKDSSSSISAALVLPFDSLLWSTILELHKSM
jgi:hypothetical protein